MAEQTNPCEQGLTPECFRVEPQHAKQVFAFRLLEALIGGKYTKRLQKMIGVPLPERVVEIMSGMPGIAVPPGVFSAVSPLFATAWEGGPVHLTQAIEGELIMPTIRRAVINFSGAETSEIVAAVAGQKISVVNVALTVGGETNLTWKSGTTAISGPMDFGGADEPRGMTHGLGDYPLQTAAGEALNLTSSIAVQVSGYITYYLTD